MYNLSQGNGAVATVKTCANQNARNTGTQVDVGIDGDVSEIAQEYVGKSEVVGDNFKMEYALEPLAVAEIVWARHRFQSLADKEQADNRVHMQYRTGITIYDSVHLTVKSHLQGLYDSIYTTRVENVHLQRYAMITMENIAVLLNADSVFRSDTIGARVVYYWAIDGWFSAITRRSAAMTARELADFVVDTIREFHGHCIAKQIQTAVSTHCVRRLSTVWQCITEKRVARIGSIACQVLEEMSCHLPPEDRFTSEFQKSGPDDAPTWTCQGKFLGFMSYGVSRTKQGAKHSAACRLGDNMAQMDRTIRWNNRRRKPCACHECAPTIVERLNGNNGSATNSDDQRVQGWVMLTLFVLLCVTPAVAERTAGQQRVTAQTCCDGCSCSTGNFNPIVSVTTVMTRQRAGIGSVIPWSCELGRSYSATLFTTIIYHQLANSAQTSALGCMGVQLCYFDNVGPTPVYAVTPTTVMGPCSIDGGTVTGYVQPVISWADSGTQAAPWGSVPPFKFWDTQNYEFVCTTDMAYNRSWSLITWSYNLGVASPHPACSATTSSTVTILDLGANEIAVNGSIAFPASINAFITGQQNALTVSGTVSVTDGTPLAVSVSGPVSVTGSTVTIDHITSTVNTAVTNTPLPVSGVAIELQNVTLSVSANSTFGVRIVEPFATGPLLGGYTTSYSGPLDDFIQPDLADVKLFKTRKASRSARRAGDPGEPYDAPQPRLVGVETNPGPSKDEIKYDDREFEDRVLGPDVSISLTSAPTKGSLDTPITRKVTRMRKPEQPVLQWKVKTRMTSTGREAVISNLYAVLGEMHGEAEMPAYAMAMLSNDKYLVETAKKWERTWVTPTLEDEKGYDSSKYGRKQKSENGAVSTVSRPTDSARPENPNRGEVLHQKRMVLARLSDKLKTWSDVYKWIVKVRPKNDWVREVVGVCSLSKDDSFACLSVVGFITGQTKEYGNGDCFCFAMSKLPGGNAKKIENQPHFATWFEETFSDSLVNCQSRGSRMGERLVGVELNPGPSPHANTTDEIKTMPELNSLKSDMSGGSGFSLGQLVARVTGFTGLAGVTSAFNVNQDHIHPVIITATNTLATPTTIDYPEAQLYPRKIRGTNGVLANNNVPTTWHSVGTANYDCEELIVSSEALSLQQRAEAGGGIRDNTTVLKGLRGTDAFNISSMAAGRMVGDNLSSYFLKLHLYILTLTWGGTATALPLSSAASKFDSYTTLSAPTTVISYNNATVLPLYSENCGGNFSFFPWGATYPAGGAGIISFHQDLSSVPTAERSSVVYLRPSLVLQTEGGDPAANIAVSALAHAPYPCGLHGVQIPTIDSTGGNAGEQSFVPFSALTRVRGIPVLRVMLPLVTSARPPTTANDAQSNLVVLPRTGPTASHTLPANSALQVSYQGALFEYELAEFLYTWMADVSTLSPQVIERFMMMEVAYFRKEHDYVMAYEMACMLSNRYFPLSQEVNGTPQLFPPQQAVTNLNSLGNRYQSAFAVDITDTALVFPAFEPTTDTMLIPGYTPMFYTAVASGMREIPDSMGVGTLDVNMPWVASIFANQYSMYQSRIIAGGYDVFFRQAGLPVTVWNALYTGTTLRRVRELYRNLWINGRGAKEPVAKAALGNYVAGLINTVFGYRLRTDRWGNTLLAYFNVPQGSPDGLFPPMLGGVNGTSVVTNIIPQTLIDIHKLLFMDIVPKCLQSFPPPNTKVSGLPSANTKVRSVPTATDQAVFIPLTASRQEFNIGLNELPESNDNEIYNARLIRKTIPNATVTDLNGNTTSSPTYLSDFVQRTVVADAFMPTYISSRAATANTWWIPLINVSGANRTVSVLVSTGQSNQLTQVAGGVAYVAAETFEIGERISTPNEITGGSTSEIPSEMAKYFTAGSTDATNSKASSETGVSGASVSSSTSSGSQ